MSFRGYLVLKVAEDAKGKPIKQGRRGMWETTHPFGYADVEVPVGTQTDLASVPRLMWSLFPPDGTWLQAAVIHDYLYRTGGINGRYTRKQADDLFKSAMADLGVSKLDRSLIYQAVRLGGGSGWRH